MITLREVEARIERGDAPEAIREFLEEAARDGKMFDSELVCFICDSSGSEDYVDNIDYFYQDFDDSSRWSIIRTKILRIFPMWKGLTVVLIERKEQYSTLQPPMLPRCGMGGGLIKGSMQSVRNAANGVAHNTTV